MKIEKYPQHEKLAARSAEHSAICDFIQYLESEGFSICEWNERSEEFEQTRKTNSLLLADYFDINPTELEKEKWQMLENFRNAHAAAAPAPGGDKQASPSNLAGK